MIDTQKNTHSNSSDGLNTGLKSRHLTMISIAGVIGGALFVGSGNVIYSAGPAALIAYSLGVSVRLTPLLKDSEIIDSALIH